MWEYTEPMRSDELYHYGRKGMRWGQRLYQNPDGTLTALGKRRAAAMRKKYTNARDKYTELTGKKKITRDRPVTKTKKQEGSKQEETKSKTTDPESMISKMSNDELSKETNRMTLEKNYLETAQNLAKVKSNLYSKKEISRGKKFVDKLIDNSLDSLAKGIGDAVGNAAKNYVNKTLGEAISDSLKDKKDKKDK